MPFQNLHPEILVAVSLSFLILLILLIMVSAAVTSILLEARTKIEPHQHEKPKIEPEY
jgi:hypothetical protein